MEYYNAFSEAISSLGFPIVMCIAMFLYIYKKDAQHKQEMDEMRKAVENNTSVIERLILKIGGEISGI